MKKIKVMHITHDLRIGGLQRVVIDIVRNLDKDNFEASVCAIRGGGPFEGELHDAGIDVRMVPRKKNGVDYFSFLKMRQILSDVAPDIVHTHNTQPLIDGGIASILAGVPGRIHTDHARKYPDKKRYTVAESLLSRFYDHIVAVSDHTRNDLVDHVHIRGEKIKVIANGIDGKKFRLNIDKAKKRSELGIDPGRNPILGIGVRLSEQKGITYLLKAMNRLRSDSPHVLLLVAGEGELSAALKAECRDLGIVENVKFIGPRLDMNEILQVLDIYVLPSIWEGMPLVLLEAMAASLPIVAADVGGVKEVVQNGRNGLLVESRNIDSLYEALKFLVLNKDMREQFGVNAFNMFNENFTIGNMVGKYQQLYFSVSGHKS